MNKRYHRQLPEDYLVEERVPYTYEDADLLNDDEALERFIESERFGIPRGMVPLCRRERVTYAIST